jgi:hypothetical protein
MSNILLKDTIPIIFGGGAYGTYMEWCLTTLATDNEILPPFTSVGSSHHFVGQHLLNIEGWNRYIANETSLSRFVRLHPKTKKEESIAQHLEVILASVEKMIYVYPDKDSVLLNVNNWFDKILPSWIPGGHRTENAHEINYFADKIYQNWPVARTVPLDKIPVWIQREFLSFYLMPAWRDQVDWYFPDRWSNENCCVVLIHDLLFNFVETITKIQKFCNLEFKRPITDITPYHDQNLSLQKYLDQDRLCQQIIQATLNNINLDWTKLPLVSESWVQWELRNQNFEIKCEGLDTFPTNSVQLKELLYTV